MKILLLFTPPGYNIMPYLGIPSLTAYMKKNGYEETLQRDLNIEFLDEILTKKRLEEACNKAWDYFYNLDKKEFLTINEQRYYINLSLSLASAPYLIRNIDKIKKYTRGQSGKVEFPVYHRFMNLLKKGIDLFFITSGDYPGNTSYDVSELIEMVNDDKNPFTEIFREKFLPFIVRFQPDLVGIGISFFDQLIPAFSMAKLIKSHTSAHITAGGSIVTVLKDKILLSHEFFTFFDSFIFSEGEIPLLNLAKTLEKKGILKDIPGLIYKSENTIKINQHPEPININKIPLPDFTGYPLDLYFSPETVLPLTITRGCSWNKCTFCAFSESFHHKFRCMEKEIIARNIKEFVNTYNIKSISFCDNSLPITRLISVLEKLKNEGINIFWSGQGIPGSPFTEDNCNKLQGLGCDLIMFGMESATQRILDLMNKNFTVEDIKKSIWNCHKAGISVLTFVIIGFPSETPEEVENTFKFLRENREAIDIICVHPFTISSGSIISSKPEKYGVRKFAEKELTTIFHYETGPGITEVEAWDIAFNSGYNNDVFYPFIKRKDINKIKLKNKLNDEGFLALLDEKIYLNKEIEFLKLNYNWSRWKDLKEIIKLNLSGYKGVFKNKIDLNYPEKGWLLYNCENDKIYHLDRSFGYRLKKLGKGKYKLKDILKNLCFSNDDVFLIKSLIEEEFLLVKGSSIGK